MRKLLLVVFLALSMGNSLVDAKGSPDLIVIRGGGLAKPIEITDREVLKKFDPWLGQFIDWKSGIISEPASTTRCFDVSFFRRWPSRHSKYDRGDLKLIYGLKYCPSARSEAGEIYLPGRGELFTINIGTIIRDGDDGKWHRASAAWENSVKGLLS